MDKICGECKWHSPCTVADNKASMGMRTEWCCGNEDSDYYTDYTDYTDTCECFEQRGVE